MGLRNYTVDFITKHVGGCEALFGAKMMELGNQYIRSDLAKSTNCKTGKEYWGSMGCFHLSIDINRKNGAMVVDLREPIDPKFFELFDIVTNIGVSCCIQADRQKQCFSNIGRITKSQGRMIHVVPGPGSKWSGTVKYPETFFKVLAELNNYEIEEITTIDGEYGSLSAASLIKYGNGELVWPKSL